MRHLLPIALLCWCTAARAQEVPDTVHLHEVVVQPVRTQRFATGYKRVVLDSAAMARHRFTDLAELLRDESTLFIKNYGPGSLATPSLRGSGAGHTAILWNGFNLGSPMNGQLDLSLVPTALAERVEVDYGGAGALWGSGAVGGAVQLIDRPRFGRGVGVDVGAALGSFGEQHQRIRAEWSADRAVSSIAFFHDAAHNDFPYVGPAAQESGEQRQTHAELRRSGVVASSAYRIGERQQLALHYWYQQSDREVPPTLMEPASTARQMDRSHRATAEWSRKGRHADAFLRAAWFDEQLHWYGQANDSAALSRSRSFITEGEMRLPLHGRQQVAFGVGLTGDVARSDGYPQGHGRVRTALFASYRVEAFKGRSATSLSVRQEAVDGAAVPFTWSLGSELQVLGGLAVRANVSRLYRIPTFNDLYWVPGGDPDLLPESGYGGELGAQLERRISRSLTLKGDIAWFQRTMDNWIIWLPSGSYWTPRNLMQVWSRGVELQAGVEWKTGSSSVRLQGQTSYVVSTNERATSANDASVDRQLIYVPMYSGHGRLSWRHRAMSASVGAEHTGYRYTSTDNSSFLPPYWLVDATLGYRVRAGHSCQLELLLHGFNLLATEYQVVAGRPMPLRSFRAGVNLHFNAPRQRAENP